MCIFLFFLVGVYIWGWGGVGSARTPPSRERGAESHFRRGETNQLSSLLLLATTNTSPHPTIPARVGEPPIKGTSPHHLAPPAFLHIEYSGVQNLDTEKDSVSNKDYLDLWRGFVTFSNHTTLVGFYSLRHRLGVITLKSAFSSYGGRVQKFLSQNHI